ncbi:putative DsbA family dithiol-disulfide isomerase [Streptomyces canus]|uniref:DsbA family dithiol-disulfide isomerase n=1 Tax=Streptomyces canus TaxID=58343 RepID=A0AAW8F4S3_9ACTN|nr:putative DsbA family dithiol-disulfide isomerase [Streptomyces canus]
MSRRKKMGTNRKKWLRWPTPPFLGVKHAADLGLDTECFDQDLRSHRGSGRIAEDVESADRSGVAGTPTFFVNGRLHHGAYDITGLSAAVRAARERAAADARRDR